MNGAIDTAGGSLLSAGCLFVSMTAFQFPVQLEFVAGKVLHCYGIMTTWLGSVVS